MDTRIEEHSVGQLAKAAGVSVRLLHHYDAIGLLTPAHVASNGYRIYRRAEALRLQEILFYRAAGIPLREIKLLLAEASPRARLIQHRQRLVQGLADQAAALATLDRTIAHLAGDDPMTLNDLYKPFTADKQAEYEAWLTATYGDEMAAAIAQAQAAAADDPDRYGSAAMAELRPIETALVAAFENGTSPQSADLAAHQRWVGKMWGAPCDAAAYAKLSELYLAHPDFIARYEALSQGFSQWLTTAMVAWAARGGKGS